MQHTTTDVIEFILFIMFMTFIAVPHLWVSAFLLCYMAFVRFMDALQAFFNRRTQ